MSKKKTTQEFIKEASLKHSNLYDYSNTVYTSALTNVLISCPIHGEFTQQANAHLRGAGCPKCGTIKAHTKTTLSTTDFVKRAAATHGSIYNYNKTTYFNASTKVIITCKIHGDFTQTPHSHLNGKGCPECGKIKSKLSQASTTEDFIHKAILVHGTKYNYTTSQYTSSKTKITITCPTHGNFQQTPNAHLDGQGCQACAKSLQGWGYSVWEAAGIASPYFDSFKLYVIKCWNDNEVFYKIGKTFNTVGRRFQDKQAMPYNWQTITIIEGNARTISELEASLHRAHKKFTYTPKLTFGGSTECFSSYLHTKDN